MPQKKHPQSQPVEIIIEIDQDLIVGNIEAPLGEILSWAFDRLKAANKKKQLVRQVILKDPVSKQCFAITPLRDAEIRLRNFGIEDKMLKLVKRRNIG